MLLLKTCRLLGLSSLLLTTNLSVAIAQSGASSPSFHLDLILQRESGEPLGDLKPSDFIVAQGATKFATSLSESKHNNMGGLHPTPRLLVIFGPALDHPEMIREQLRSALRVFWKSGWQTAFVLADGTTTPYANDIPPFGSPRPSVINFDNASEMAIQSLGTSPGKKAVLYLPGSTSGYKKVKTPESISRSSVRNMAILYVVDGGQPSRAEDIQAERFDEMGVLHTYIDPKVPVPEHEKIRNGVRHEVNLPDAFRAIREDMRGYYTLEVTAHSGTILVPNQPIMVSIKSGGRIRIAAQSDAIAKNIPLEFSER